jgi:hypothetical protein
MTERLSALFCIGCDRLDVPEPCLGACDERVLDLVSAKDHDEARAQVGKAIQQADKLRELLIQLVSKMPEPSAPMPDDWADTHHALQAQARTVLHEIDPSGALEEADRITAWRCLTCGLDRSRAGMSWDLCGEPGRLVDAGDLTTSAPNTTSHIRRWPNSLRSYVSLPGLRPGPARANVPGSRCAPPRRDALTS